MYYDVQRPFQQYFSYIVAVTGLPEETTNLQQDTDNCITYRHWLHM